MISARIFVCHNLKLTENTHLETQVFQQLCQRLREVGTEVVVYSGRASEETFFTFCYQELPTCQWFLLFQTPDIVLVPTVHTAVNIAQTRVQQGQMQGVLRFPVLPDKTSEQIPEEWSAIPSLGTSRDYLRAIEKLILSLSLHEETGEEEDTVVPPPPLPFLATTSPLSLSTPSTQLYDSTLPQTTDYDSSPSLHLSVNQPVFSSALPNPSNEQPKPNPSSEQPKRPPKLRIVRIVMTLLSIILVLIVLLVTVSPLRALIIGPQVAQHGASPTQGPMPTVTTQATVASNSDGGAFKTKATPSPTSSLHATPTPEPATRPTATPRTAACPATLQFGDTGPEVTMLQQELQARGMQNLDGSKLTVNGNFDADTEAAVVSWQIQENIDVSGDVGPATWRSLGNC